MWMMWKRRKHLRGAATPVPLELCDRCGTAFPEADAVTGYVADSSCAQPLRPWFDGMRRITACCAAHYESVRDEYRLRPFVEEELWAAKIERVLRDGAPVCTLEELGRRTGLDEPDIHRAVAWHNDRLRRMREEDAGEGTSDGTG
ncbi:hypothetical protein ACFW6K_32485 [Streptomyces sp. NPDC058733]|uniref:hypothetical protein n=2 Tax=unclassified Streptomyces TaxID=2593676 RepID=UPI003455D3B2